MRALSLVFIWFGRIYIFFFSITLFFAIFNVWMTEGFSRVQQIMSPFNVFGMIAILIILLPGFGSLYLGEKFKKKVLETQE